MASSSFTWLRLHHEARNDAKLRSLDDRQFRVWFNLLCLSGEQPTRGVIAGYELELLAVEVASGDSELLAGTLDRLERVRIIGRDHETITFLNFNGDPPTRPAASVWRVIRAAIFRRDDFTCRYCGKRGGRLECDHVIPVSRGGSHDPDNLVTACFECNRSKRAKTPEEWSR